MRTKRLGLVLTFLSMLGLGSLVYSHPNVQESPRVMKAVAPKDYPPLASAAMVSGKVKIDVRIDSTGGVIAAQIVEGHPLLKDISKTAALHWKFARSEEAANERTAQLTFTFIHWTERKEEERGITTFVPPFGIELVGRTAYVQRESIR